MEIQNVKYLKRKTWFSISTQRKLSRWNLKEFKSSSMQIFFFWKYLKSTPTLIVMVTLGNPVCLYKYK